MCDPVGAALCPSDQLEEGKIMERRKKIALELSDLVIYCRPVPFDEDSKDITHTANVAEPLLIAYLHRQSPVRQKYSVGHFCLFSPPVAEIGTERACFRDMSSFPETKAEKYVNKIKGKKFLQYNRLQLSRIYPRGQRLDSSNYDPLPMWLCGSQLVALNFQTAGICPSSCQSRQHGVERLFFVC